jgi:hypothetical protein
MRNVKWLLATGLIAAATSATVSAGYYRDANGNFVPNGQR